MVYVYVCVCVCVFDCVGVQMLKDCGVPGISVLVRRGSCLAPWGSLRLPSPRWRARWEHCTYTWWEPWTVNQSHRRGDEPGENMAPTPDQSPELSISPSKDQRRATNLSLSNQSRWKYIPAPRDVTAPHTISVHYHNYTHYTHTLYNYTHYTHTIHYHNYTHYTHTHYISTLS